MQLITDRQAQQILGIATTLFYEWRNLGLVPAGVRLGQRAVRYPRHEIEILARARVAGLTEDGIRQLVRAMISRRAATMDELLGAA